MQTSGITSPAQARVSMAHGSSACYVSGASLPGHMAAGDRDRSDCKHSGIEGRAGFVGVMTLQPVTEAAKSLPSCRLAQNQAGTHGAASLAADDGGREDCL